MGTTTRWGLLPGGGSRVGTASPESGDYYPLQRNATFSYICLLRHSKESGRAGRDGLPSRCLLFYRFSDVMRQVWTHAAGVDFNLRICILCESGVVHQCHSSDKSSHCFECQAAIVCMEPTWHSNLMSMTRYAAAAAGRCKRAIIQAHFAERASECCGMCDCCSSSAALEKVDVSSHVISIVKALQVGCEGVGMKALRVGWGRGVSPLMGGQ